ncbi:hypothetical protein JTE90_007837 [Oedothorax gibbosus]|uniref:Uncharacterized protein n=1 Tax=Oedothorax gibbosus TaxID=931172 RepID=A0AAV6VHD7_9ARAC|nr:hypothetical protein JTE90_007837 [Oedothorax gibbosus]
MLEHRRHTPHFRRGISHPATEPQPRSQQLTTIQQNQLNNNSTIFQQEDTRIHAISIRWISQERESEPRSKNDADERRGKKKSSLDPSPARFA